MPNGMDAQSTRAVKEGRATRIADYTGEGHRVHGRHSGSIRGQNFGLRAAGYRVGRSNKGIGTAKQQVSETKAQGLAKKLRATQHKAMSEGRSPRLKEKTFGGPGGNKPFSYPKPKKGRKKK